MQSSSRQDVSSLHLPAYIAGQHQDTALFAALCSQAWPAWLPGLEAGAQKLSLELLLSCSSLGAKTGFPGLPAYTSRTLCSDDGLRCHFPGVLIKGSGSSWLLFLSLNLELTKSDIKLGVRGAGKGVVSTDH